MTILKQKKDWILVSFGGGAYKVINKNKCYYESLQFKRAYKYFKIATN